MRRFILIFFCLLLTGCTYYAPPGENHPVRVVTAIDVTAAQEGSLIRYRYTENEKIGTILQYLRQLAPDQVTPITPDTFRSDAYEIRLTLSDGSQNVYYQIYDEYLQKDNGPWKSIDKAQGATLPQLLAATPSDPV